MGGAFIINKVGLLLVKSLLMSALCCFSCKINRAFTFSFNSKPLIIGEGEAAIKSEFKLFVNIQQSTKPFFLFGCMSCQRDF